MVLNGIDRINDYEKLFFGKRLGFITSPAAVDINLASGIQLLHKKYGLTALFGPEHGVRGDCDAGVEVPTYNDPFTGVPVYSLYRKGNKRLSEEMLSMVDAVVYDIPDVGARYYTFISTLLYALEDCAQYDKELILLDRVNPLGGAVAEGNILEEECKSFVGCHPICTRYGLTAGEIATMMNAELKINCRLHIVPCEGYKREMLFPETGNVFMMPSLGIPKFETALLYPGTCLIEGTNLSEGRGTSCPFEIIGAPFIDAQKLSSQMNSIKLDGVKFTPAYFTPTSSKHNGVKCGGVHFHITSYKDFQPVKAGIELLDAVRNMYEKDFLFLPPVKEHSRPFITLLAGSRCFEKKEWSKEELLSIIKSDSKAFEKQKKEFHIY